MMLGDRIERWARPIKRWLRRRGWFPEECGCEERQRRLNEWHRKVMELARRLGRMFHGK